MEWKVAVDIPNSFSVWTIHTVSLPVHPMIVFAVHHSELLDIQAGHVTPLTVELRLDPVGFKINEKMIEAILDCKNIFG